MAKRQKARGRRLAMIQPERCRRRPVREKEIPDRSDGRRGALQQRMSFGGIADGGREDLLKRRGSIVAQQQKERVERARNASRQESRAGHKTEAETSVVLDRGTAWCRALATYHFGPIALCVMKHDRSVAARTVQMRLYDLQCKRSSHRGVEGVAAAFEHSHPNRRRDPMGRRNDAKCALDFGPCGEAVRIDKAHSLTDAFFPVQPRARTSVPQFLPAHSTNQDPVSLGSAQPAPSIAVMFLRGLPAGGDNDPARVAKMQKTHGDPRMPRLIV
jgi:hypothetical protein